MQGLFAFGISKILIALLVFGIIIMIHELGHFVAAKISGVKVDEFSLGMGPKLFSIQGEETLYAIRLFPIAGYVKMVGENEESDHPRSFSKKNPLKRFFIIVMGPVMNFVLAIVLYTIIFSSTGLPSTTIGELTTNSPASKVGIQVEDKILDIDGQSVENWTDIPKIINTVDSEYINIKIKRDEEILDFKVEPMEEDGRKLIGVVPKYEKNIFKTFSHSIKTTFSLLAQMIEFLGRAVQGKVKETVVGPVGIIKIVGDTSANGILPLLFLAAAISVNLGLMNLLPIPALDGGRIIFIILEVIRGKKLGKNIEEYIHAAFLGLLLLFMVFITYKDVSRLIFK
ncbi:RIP metalloprotease RseP [Peptostreptococcaceae bacterium AGR-M142]